MVSEVVNTMAIADLPVPSRRSKPGPRIIWRPAFGSSNARHHQLQIVVAIAAALYFAELI